MRDADLVVAADGINSRVRETFAQHFKPSIDLRPNKFTWMGSTRPFDAFTFFFRETEFGIFIAALLSIRARPFDLDFRDRSRDLRTHGPRPADEAGSAKLLEKLFAEELQGHRLITNRSIWRNFPMIRCERWVHDNVVLIGDAKATAHFSIGSGTKLAMEDAIALYRSVPRDRRDVTSRRRCRISRRTGARKSKRPSIRPTCRWSGSST